MPVVSNRNSRACQFLCSCLPRFLPVATKNFDHVRVNHLLIVEFEVDILDVKGPHIVAEPIDIEVAL